MAHSNYKVLTDVDLSNNQLLNVSKIENTEEASKSLFIKTGGNTTLDAANLTSIIDGKMSLETGTSEVTVKGTATETITTSKTTTVATTTTETIDSTGVTVNTPSQTIEATRSSKTTSPSIVFVTGPLDPEDESEQASLTITKKVDDTSPRIDIAAKTIAVDATDTITQTAPTSTYTTTDGNRKIVLDNTDITLTSNLETVKLGSAQTRVSGTELFVDTDTVNVKHTGTHTVSASEIHLKTNDDEDNPASSLDILPGGTTLKSPEIALNGTSNGVTVKSGDNSSSVAVKSTSIEIDSKGTLDVSANGNISVDNPGFTIDIDTENVLEKATGSSTVRSPSITLVTGEPEGTGTNKQAKITLTKTASMDNSAIDASAKTITVDADVAGGSITQTAPTSTYKTAENNKIVLNSEGITLTNVSETVKLGGGQTSIDGTELCVSATTANIDNSITAITSTGGITAKTDAGSELKILAGETTLKSPKVTLNGTGTEGVTIKSGDTVSSSIAVKNTSVNIDSKDVLGIYADKGITIGDEKSVKVTAPSISETATNGSIESTAGTITLATNKSSGENAGNSTLTIDGNTSTLNTGSSTVAATTITQTASTSIYKADDSNKLEIGTGSAKITSGTETIALAKAKDGTAAKTTISSSDLVASATKITVENNTTTSITSSESVTVTAESSDGTSTLTTKPTKIGLESKEVSLTASATGSEGKKSSRITLSPAASAEGIALSLDTDKNLKISSRSGAMIEDDKSIDLIASTITESSDTSISLYSGNINFQNTKDNAAERIALNDIDHKVSLTANTAGVDIVGNTSNTVTVKGTEFKVSSGKSTFAENSKFNKNVEVVGNLTTSNMTGEAATLNSLDVKATTTVTGNLETGAATFSDVTATGVTVTGSLEAERGMTAKGPVSINGVDESGKSLTVTKTASTENLTVDGELKTENGGVTSAGSISILNNGSAPTSLTVNNTAEVNNLSVPGGTLTASNGMTSTGAITVGSTTSVGTITGTGFLNIPGTAVLEATNGGTTGSVGVTETTIHTIKGDGFLEIPANSKLTVATNSENTSSSIAVTNIGIATIEGGGSLEVPTGSKLTINNGGTSGTSATGTFEPTNIKINKIFGDGSLEVPGGKTLTASSGGTINGSMTIGKAGSTAANLTLYGNATIGTSGDNETTLTSDAKIVANKTLAVTGESTFTGKATLSGGAVVESSLNLTGVTIKWDSTLGALTFSKG